MFDNEQREELKSMEGRIIERLGQIDIRLESLEVRVEDDTRAVETHVIERLREVETNMLRQFYDWSKPVEMRLRSIEDIATRMGLVEERVAALERKKFENGK